MKKELVFENLPHGAGAAIGNFIRSIYMTASSRYAIIGISVGKYGFFDSLPGTTTLVSDLISEITREDYQVKPDAIANCQTCVDTGMGEIYVVQIPLADISELNTEDFSRVLSIKRKTLAKFMQPQSFTISFYIMNVQGVMKEEISSACLLDAFKEESIGIIPLSAVGQHTMNCWHTIERNEFTESVTIHLEASEAVFEADFDDLKATVSQYMGLIVNILLSSSS